MHRWVKTRVIPLTFQANRGSEELIQREEYLEDLLRLTRKETTRAWDIPSVVNRQHIMCSSTYNKSKQITEVGLLKMTCKAWHNYLLLLFLLTSFFSSWLVRQHHRSSCSLSVKSFLRCKILHTSGHSPSEANSFPTREALLAASSTLHVIYTTIYLNHTVTYPMHTTHNHI